MKKQLLTGHQPQQGLRIVATQYFVVAAVAG
jgi:hypothetical protein